MRGRLILIEGLDRSGKSTQAARLAARLGARLFRFPDRLTVVGKLINEYLTNEECNLPDEAAHLLFSANRWEVAREMEQVLASGTSVVLDRYVYSGVAYSLAKDNLNDAQWLLNPDRGLPKPDLTIFLTISLEELSLRKGWGDERYEKEAFQAKVKECFLQVLNLDNDPSVAIVDVGSLLIEAAESALWLLVEQRGVDSTTEEPLQRL